MKSDQMLNFMHLSNQANALRGLPARHWVIEAMRSSMRVRLGTTVAYPYLLPLSLTVLLLQRAARDDKKCGAKYGDLWQRYCERVRFRIFPYLY